MSSPRVAGLPWLRVIAVLVLIAIWFASQRAELQRKSDPPVEPAPKPVSIKVIGKEPKSDERRETPADENRFVIRNLVLRDETGRVIHRGDIDLAPTLDRIAAGELLDRFPNDGSAFQNRERRLPKQPPGYYREYVVPTPGERSPGPQRLVIGREGEVYYTHDHYRTFRKVW